MTAAPRGAHEIRTCYGRAACTIADAVVGGLREEIIVVTLALSSPVGPGPASTGRAA